MQLIIRNLKSNCSLSNSVAFALSYYQNLNLKSEKDTFYAKDVVINKVQKLVKPKLNYEKLQFGTEHSDHLLICDWEKGKGWKKPRIEPFANMKIHPFSSALHYSIQCFEGMKAYKTKEGKINLFRPQLNMYRFKSSMKSLSLPDFDGNELLKLIKLHLKLDINWIPPKQGFSLYMRPLGISMEETLGVAAPNKARIVNMLSPVPPFFGASMKPIKLITMGDAIRAAPGGYGQYKMGGNYGPTIKFGEIAAKKGYNQVLWQYEGMVQEVGTSNLFFYWTNKDGEKELITPKLDGTILPGTTRDSIIELVRSYNICKITERKIMIDEITEAIEDNRMIEAFSSGTAVICVPISVLNHGDKDYQIPINPEINAGDLTHRIYLDISDIQYGRKNFKGWGQIIE